MKLTIIGTGYVGLVTGTCFAEMGNKVYCVDNDLEKIANLKNNILPIYEPNLASLVKSNQKKGDLTGSSLIVIKSTVPVGTAFKVKKVIESNLNKDIKIDIASNPEFLKEGVAIADCMHPDRVIIGAQNDEVFETLKELYSSFIVNSDRFVLMDVKSAEMSKYVANALLATKISFMNEIANICEKVGANVKNVRLGIGSDKRIGYDFIYAGCGYGGSCFPKDVKGLINTALDNGYEPKILANVDDVNENQKLVLVNKIVDRFGEDLSGLTFGIWGLSFKPQTDDVRCAPSLIIASEIIKRGGKIKAYDPKAIDNFRQNFDSKNIDYKKSKYDVLDDSDCLVLITEWKEFRALDLDELAKRLNQKIIFDGRNIYSPKIREAGFELYQIGC